MKYFIKIDTDFLKSPLLNTQTKIYLYIKSYQDNGKKCFASLNRFCVDLDLKMTILKKSLKKLEKDGFIEIVKHKEKGKNAFNLYSLKGYNSLVIDSPISEDEIKKGYKKTIRAPKTSQNGHFKREFPLPSWYSDYEKKDFDKNTLDNTVELTESAKKLFNHGSDLK